MRPPRKLVTSRLVNPRRSRPRLAILAFCSYRTLKLGYGCGFQVLSQAKQFACLGRKNLATHQDLPYGKIPDGIFLQAGTRGARLCLRQNSHIAPSFKSCRKQSSLLAWAEKINPRRKAGVKFFAPTRT